MWAFEWPLCDLSIEVFIIWPVHVLLIVLPIDKGCISLKILSNIESMDCIFEDLHVFLFYTDDLDNDHASDYESTEVFDDTVESLLRKVTNSIGGYWWSCCSGQYWMCEGVLNLSPNSE